MDQPNKVVTSNRTLALYVMLFVVIPVLSIYAWNRYTYAEAQKLAAQRRHEVQVAENAKRQLERDIACQKNPSTCNYGNGIMINRGASGHGIYVRGD